MIVAKMQLLFKNFETIMMFFSSTDVVATFLRLVIYKIRIHMFAGQENEKKRHLRKNHFIFFSQLVSSSLF